MLYALNLSDGSVAWSDYVGAGILRRMSKTSLSR